MIGYDADVASRANTEDIVAFDFPTELGTFEKGLIVILLSDDVDGVATCVDRHHSEPLVRLSSLIVQLLD